MSITSPDTRPDVTAFVAAVRARLADLPADDRDELLDGLEADLAEQLADGATGVLGVLGDLGDPATYAAELRAAAGLPSSGRARRVSVPSLAGVAGAVDSARTRGSELVRRHRGLAMTWSVLEALRPAWWVLRAWIAVTALDQASGAYERVTLVPHLEYYGLGPVLLALAVVVSVLIGQGQLWPGSGPARRLLSRVVLIVLNVLAVLLPLGFAFSPADSVDDPGFRYGFSDGYARGLDDRPPGLAVKGRDVTNVFAYDLAGNPIEGVQLFDQEGRPVTLAADTTAEVDGERGVVCPWFNGASELYGVFPLQQQRQQGRRCDAGKDAANPIQAPTAPLAQVPPVTRTPAP